jgi:translocator protein
MRKPLRLAISLLAPLIAGVIGSLATYSAIQGWYAGLDKPFFSPPNWLFGPVWTTLYILMGVACYLVWTARIVKHNKLAKGYFFDSKSSPLSFLMGRSWASKLRRAALTAYGVQLVLNVAWSVAFFGLRSPWLGVVVIAWLWMAIMVTIILFRLIDKRAACLMLPYILWVSFAMILNISLAVLNS